MTPVLIALGTNLGARERHLARAVAGLKNVVELEAGSAIYETRPMYVEDQPPFLNAVVLARTSLGPLALLAALKSIESGVGRALRERNGPREIDLDLIVYGALRLFSGGPGDPKLVIPHPRAAERLFVLQPAHDIATNLRLPGLGSIAELLRTCPDDPTSVVRRSDAILSLRCD